MPFPITCASCGKTFTIADDIFERKVKGRVVTIKCKQCQGGIRVDGTAGGASPAKNGVPAPEISLGPKPPAAAPTESKAEAPAAETKKPAEPQPAPAAEPPAAEAPSPAKPALAATATPMPKPAAVATPMPKPAALATKQPAAATPLPTAKTQERALQPKPKAQEVLWAVETGNGDRELTQSELARELKDGTITAETLVWREGMGEWEELGKVAELSSLLAKPKVPEPKPAPQMPAAPREPAKPVARAKQPSAPNLDDRAPLPPPRAKQPSAPALTGGPARAPQRSSPGLEAPPPPRGRLPSAPKLVMDEPPRAPGAAPFPKPPAPAVVDSDVVTSAPPLPPQAAVLQQAGVPLEATFPPELQVPPQPQAPGPLATPTVTAPLALSGPLIGTGMPERSAMPIQAVAPMPGGPDEWPAPKRKPIVIIGLVAAVAVVGIVVAVASSGSEDELPPATSIAPLPPTVPTPSPREARDTPPASEPPTASTERPAPNTGNGPAEQPQATPGAGFAELFAAGARRAEEKGGAIGPAQRFDPNAAKAALTAAGGQVMGCREKGGPSGKVTVVVTFEPTGKASSATVSDAPFAGTPAGSCIAGVMKRVTIPPFSGLPGTVSKTIMVH